MADATHTGGLARSVGRNTAIQFLGKIIGTILGVVTAGMIQRYLRVEGYGVYTAAMAYVGFFSVVADLGLYLILIRELNKPGADEDRVVGNLLAIRWTSAFIVLTLSAAIIWLIPAYNHTVRVAVAVASVSFVAVAATQLLVGLFQTKMAMIRVTVAELVGRVVLLGGAVVVVMTNAGLYALLGAVVGGSLLNFLIVWWSARRYVSLRLRFEWPYWRTIIVDTLPVSASIVLNLIYFKADTIMLSFFHKGDYAIGLYGSAYKVLEILITFPSIFVGLLLPALGQAFQRGQPGQFQAVFQKGFDLLLMMGAPILVGGWILAQQILVAIGKTEFAPGGPVLQLLLIALLASFLNSLSGHSITIINRQRQMVWGYLGVAVIGLIAYLTLIPRFSYYGAAWGTIVTESLAAIIGYILILRVMKFRLSLRAVPNILLGCAAMGGSMYLFRHQHFLIAGFVGAFVYAAIIVLTKTVPLATLKAMVTRSAPAAIPPYDA